MKKKFSSVPDPDMQDAVIYARYSSHSQRDCSIEQQVTANFLRSKTASGS